MSTRFTIDTTPIVFDNNIGRILAEGSLLDLHYAITTIISENPEASKEEQFTEFASVLENKFQPNQSDVEPVSWATAASIAIRLSELMEEEKKN